MRVEIGQRVRLRDGRIVWVTDASSQELNVWEDEGGPVREENILIGILAYPKVSDVPVTIVTDMSEVVAIIEE